MYQIIAPTLFQNKICKLPGIGTLRMLAHPAETDFINSRILPPLETIDFTPEKEGDGNFNEFSAMSELLNKNLEQDGRVELNGIGSFTKDAEGTIKFSPVEIDPIFFQSVTAERVLRDNAEHNMLVGDQQRTNVQMTEYFNEKPTTREKWKVFALVLGAIGLGLLILYFARHGFNGLGNSKSI